MPLARNSHGRQRKNFPRSEAQTFLSHLKRVLGELCDADEIFDGISMSNYFEVLAVSARSLKGQEGIQIFLIQLNFISQLVRKILEQGDIFDRLNYHN